MLPDRHAAASTLHLRRALLFAALGYAYVAAVLLLLAGVIATFARLGLGAPAAYALSGIFFVAVISFLVGFVPPMGRRVTRAECPELFRAIDRARGELRAPEVDGVFLTDEMNAAVMERPRFGTVGWSQRFLFVGLPLLHALPEDEIRAILAHELAHLSRQHNRSLRLLMRAAGTWTVLELAFAASWARFLFIPFFRWYTPRLEALTQQTRRAYELESDRLAARAAGAPAMARALVRLALWTGRLERVVWPSVLRGSLEREAPRADDFVRVLDALAEPPGAEDRARLVRSALRDRTLDNHSHPSLADRLEALGVDAAEAERGLAAGSGSAGGLLGARAPELAAEVGAAWAESAAPLWRRCHADARIWTGAQGAGPSPEALWAHARWAAHCEPPEAAIPLLRRAQERAEARVLLGTLLLDQEDHAAQDEAVRLLEAESRGRTAWALDANEALGEFYARVGWPRDLRRCRERRMELAEAARRALEERTTLSARDTLRPCPLPPAGSAALVSVLRELGVRTAWLVQKRLRNPDTAPALVLAIDTRVPWYRPDGGIRRAQELCARVQLRVDLPEPLDAVVVVERGSALRRRLRGLAGAEIFRAEGPPARAAASPGWASPSRAALVGLPGAPAVATVLVMGFGVYAAIDRRTPASPAAALRAAPEVPADPEAAWGLAFRLFHENRGDEARAVLTEAVRRNPDNVDLRSSLGWMLNQQGKFEESIPVLREAVRIDPRYADAHHRLGWAFLHLERYEEAEAPYREAIRLTPTRPGAHSELGMVLLHLGRLDDAEKELNEAVRLRNTDAWTYRTLGRVHKGRSKLREAAAAYRMAADYDQHDAEIWGEIGHLEHLLGNFRESSAAFENARRLDPLYFQRDSYRRAIWEASNAGRTYVPPGY